MAASTRHDHWRDGSSRSRISRRCSFPSSGFTKGQLIDYYVRIAPVMLPHLRERPLTMKRFPDGVEGKSFFEKHIPSHAPEWVPSVDVSATDGQDVIPYAMVNDLPTLAWAANLGTIELHVPLWHVGRRRKLPARPDHMVFDLDPGEGTSIVECCVVAGYIMDELAQQGTDCFAKTSGSKGLQLYAAVGPKTTWDSLRDRAHEHRAQAGIRPSGPGRLQHAQVVAPRASPDRLEPEPSGQDDGRRLLGAGHVDADRVDAGQRRPRCGGAPPKRTLCCFGSRRRTSCDASRRMAISSRRSAWLIRPNRCCDEIHTGGGKVVEYRCVVRQTTINGRTMQRFASAAREIPHVSLRADS